MRHGCATIDMDAISFEIAVGWIAEATQALERKEFGADAVTAQQVKGDPILSDAIDIALARQLPAEGLYEESK